MRFPPSYWILSCTFEGQTQRFSLLAAESNSGVSIDPLLERLQGSNQENDVESPYVNGGGVTSFQSNLKEANHLGGLFLISMFFFLKKHV